MPANPLAMALVKSSFFAMRYRLNLVAMTLSFSTPPTAQMTEAQMPDAARNMAAILGLSPAGTELWARQSVERAHRSEYNDVTEVEVAIGQELARPSPDRARLDTLIDQYAKQSAAIQRRSKSRELDDAFELSPSDG